MFENLSSAIAARPRPKQGIITYGVWPGGLVTDKKAEQLRKDELSECVNFVLVSNGVLRTRDGSTLVCSGCTGEIVQCEDINVQGTWYTIMSDTDNKVYYNDSGTATAIATLEGEAHFCGFMGFLILFDGSYIKAWDGTKVFMLYDNGLGSTTPYQYNNRNLTPDATYDKHLGDGTTTVVEQAFTSQTWTAGYTIPVTHVYATMYKVGAPTGTVTAKIIRVSDSAVMASKEISTAVDDFVTDTDGLEYEAIFAASDVTTELSPAVDYKLSLEYSGGDASNYVVVKGADASNVITGVKPGKPPKAVFGLVFQDRLHCIEGADGSNPSYRWYCNTGNHLDWSSPNGGGYTPVVDSSGTNYPINAISVWNNELWVFGTDRQPFLGKQTGTTPSSWAIYPILKEVSAHYRSVVSAENNIIFTDKEGIKVLASVQEAIGIAVKNHSSGIAATIRTSYSDNAVAGYDPEWGLYLLKMENNNSVYVVHTKVRAYRYLGQSVVTYHPITKWQFAWETDELPTGFGRGQGFCLIGTNQGRVYKMDNTKINDNLNSLTYKLKTNYPSTKFGENQAYKLSVGLSSRTGGKITLDFYANNSRTPLLTEVKTLLIDDDILTLSLTDILTVNADFLISSDIYFDREDINFNFRSMKIGVSDIKLYGEPLYIDKFTLLYQGVGGL